MENSLPKLCIGSQVILRNGELGKVTKKVGSWWHIKLSGVGAVLFVPCGIVRCVIVPVVIVPYVIATSVLLCREALTIIVALCDCTLRNSVIAPCVIVP